MHSSSDWDLPSAISPSGTESRGSREQRVQHAEHGLQRDAVWNTDLWWQPFLLVFQPWNAQLLQMDIVSVFGLAVGWWHQPGTAVMIMSAGHHQAQHNPRVAQASPCHC